MKIFSIIIPVFNEENNIEKLINEILNSLKKFPKYEIIIVDDGSTDNIQKLLIRYLKEERIVIIKHKKNIGQSKSILTGIRASNFDTIITLDGDGQNNPSDIPILVKKFFSDKQLSLVGGIRVSRKDGFIKSFSSKIANLVRSKYLDDGCTDTGCALKVFDKNIFLKFNFFDGIHRFLPALFKGYGYKTFFIPVSHRVRIHGKSKYGIIKRLFIGLSDMYKVKQMIKKNNL